MLKHVVCIGCLTGLVCGLVLADPEGAAARGLFNRDGFLLIDGAPRLVMGFYELPESDLQLAALAAHGFNLVRVSDRAGLDRVQQHGLYGWITVDVRTEPGDETGRQRLLEKLTPVKDHPALLVWELPDEIVWGAWYNLFPWVFGGQKEALRVHIEEARSEAAPETTAARLARLERADDLMRRGLSLEAEKLNDALWRELGKENPQPAAKMSECSARVAALTEATMRGCRLLREIDPRHIIWQNHAPRNVLATLQRYNRAVDAAGCDIYPAPPGGTGHSDLTDTSLSAVGAYTDRMRAAAPGKAVWMVLQGFGWRDITPSFRDGPDPDKGRRPTSSETRFMAYDAIVHGAQAILYWGTHYIEKDGALWADVLKVAREIRALEPAIVGERPASPPRAVADETAGSVEPDQGPRLMLRHSGDDWLLIAVNEADQGLSFTVSGLPAELEGVALQRLYSDETHTVRNGRFRDGIRPIGVHVYATSRRFETANVRLH